MDPDLSVRVAAIEHVLTLARRYDDVIPRAKLLRNLEFAGKRNALLNPQSGIHRPRLFRGPAAFDDRDGRAEGRPAPPYADAFDVETGTISHSYRQGPVDSPTIARCAPHSPHRFR